MTASPLPSLPDLSLEHVRIELEMPAVCDPPSLALGTAVTVYNAGRARSGPFEVMANSARQSVIHGLAPGETARLWFPGAMYGRDTVVVVDAGSQVAEGDEANNVFIGRLEVPTLSPPCP